MNLLTVMHSCLIFVILKVGFVLGFVRQSLRYRVPIKLKANWASTAFNQVPRTETPSRYDTCKLLVSGVVGTEPKEIYLKSGHYVVNFALAVVGHFRAIHQQELLKPAETMWLSMEMWDELAKKNYANIKKGRPVRGVGYVIQNKWTDKDSGEERKMYKVRITKMMAAEEFEKVSELLEDIDDSRNSKVAFPTYSDTSFSGNFPDNEDQTIDYGGQLLDRTIAMPTIQIDSGGGYTYRKLSVPLAVSKSGVVAHTAPQHQYQTNSPNQQTVYSYQRAQQPQPASQQPVSPVDMPPPGAGGDGQHIWESLKSEYPGMVKPMQRVVTPMSREPTSPM